MLWPLKITGESPIKKKNSRSACDTVMAKTGLFL